MSLPKETLSKIDEALNVVRIEIKQCQQKHESYGGLQKIEKELLEMRDGTRKMSSDEVIRLDYC